MSGFVLFGVGDEFTNDIKLMVAGENEGFFFLVLDSVGGGDFGFFGFDVEEPRQDVDEAIFLQNV